MRHIITFSILFIVSFGMTQELQFDKLDNVPEYRSNSQFYWEEDNTTILVSVPRSGTTNPTGRTFVASFNGDPFIEFCSENLAPRTFERINSNQYLGATFQEIYLLSKDNGLQRLYVLNQPNERIIRIINTGNSNIISFATDKGLYISMDFGINFTKIKSFNQGYYTLASTVDNFLFVVFFDGINYYIEKRENQGILLSETKLDFIPYSILSYDGELLLASENSNIYSVNIENLGLSRFDRPDIGTSPILKLFNDTLLVHKFQDQQLILLNDDYQTISTMDLGSRYFSPRNKTLFLFSQDQRLVPTSLSPLRFDTLRPAATATNIKDVQIFEDNLYAISEDNFYRLEGDEWEFSINAGTRFSIDHQGNLYVLGENFSPEIRRSTDMGQSWSNVAFGGASIVPWVNFRDTSLFVGQLMCDEFIPGFTSLITSDGGESWQPLSSGEPPCFKKRHLTITKDRIYMYDHDQSYALGPGVAIYSWFGYFDRNRQEIRMIEPDRSLPFVPQSQNEFGERAVYFYVSPDETFYMNPARLPFGEGSRDSIGYYSKDFGQSWIATPDVPWGRIYPTPDSLGTLVVQNSGPKDSPRFFVRYDVTQPYEELTVTPSDLPPVDYLLYNSQEQMIIASESGHFHIADGITSAVEEVRAEQLGGLKVWPNPASHEITVKHLGEHIQEVSIYDLMGKAVRSVYSGESKALNIDVSGLSAGVYYVQSKAINGKRIVKQLVIGGK